MAIMASIIKTSCAICFVERGEEFLKLFEVGDHGVTLTTLGGMYENFSGMKIVDVEIFPDCLCRSCSLQLQVYTTLKCKALKSYRKIRSCKYVDVDNLALSMKISATTEDVEHVNEKEKQDSSVDSNIGMQIPYCGNSNDDAKEGEDVKENVKENDIIWISDDDHEKSDIFEYEENDPEENVKKDDIIWISSDDDNKTLNDSL